MKSKLYKAGDVFLDTRTAETFVKFFDVKTKTNKVL